MTAETRKQLEGIYKRYQEHGVTLQEVIGVYNSAIEYEVPPQQAIIGVRLALANTYGEHELFTVEDVAAITGETPRRSNPTHRRQQRRAITERGYNGSI